MNEGQPSGVVRREREAFVAALLPVLLQGGARHWSQSVNTLRGRALRVLHKLDADAFDVRLPPSPHPLVLTPLEPNFSSLSPRDETARRRMQRHFLRLVAEVRDRDDAAGNGGAMGHWRLPEGGRGHCVRPGALVRLPTRRALGKHDANGSSNLQHRRPRAPLSKQAGDCARCPPAGALRNTAAGEHGGGGDGGERVSQGGGGGGGSDGGGRGQ